MKKLVIFDLDGTLLNTIADLAHSTNYALNKLGYPTHEIEKYNFMVGNGINKLFERALPEGEKTEENVLRVRNEFIPYYDIHNADDSCPYPGISALLSYLQSAGIQIAVASNPAPGGRRPGLGAPCRGGRRSGPAALRPKEITSKRRPGRDGACCIQKATGWASGLLDTTNRRRSCVRRRFRVNRRSRRGGRSATSRRRR